MRLLIVCDLDGCIVDGRERYRLAGSEPEGDKTNAAHQTWVKTVMNPDIMKKDKPVPGMYELLRALHGMHDIVYVTSREECHREVTENWLKEHKFLEFSAIDFNKHMVLMRPQGSLELDHILKESAILDLKRVLYPDHIVVLDDDLKGGLAKVCKARGWGMLKVQGASL